MTLLELITKHLGIPGKMLSNSKSQYRQSYPDSQVYFNGCIFDKDLNQVWWGDIDTTRDKPKLYQIANEAKEIFYVTPENPFRTDFNKVDQKLIDSDAYVIKFGDGSA